MLGLALDSFRYVVGAAPTHAVTRFQIADPRLVEQARDPESSGIAEGFERDKLLMYLGLTERID